MTTARASVCWPLPLSLEIGEVLTPPKTPLNSWSLRALPVRSFPRFMCAPFKLLRSAGLDDLGPSVGLLAASVIVGSWRKVVRPTQSAFELLVGEDSSLSSDLAFHLFSFPVRLARKLMAHTAESNSTAWLRNVPNSLIILEIVDEGWTEAPLLERSEMAAVPDMERDRFTASRR